MIKHETTRIFAFFTCLHFFGRTFCGAFNTAVNKRPRQLHSTLLLKWLPSGSIIGRADSPTFIFSTPSDDMEGRHSFVEGGVYDDQFAEIEAMGGDPFFLYDEESEVKMAKEESAILPEKLDSGAILKKANERYPMDGKGPMPNGGEKKTKDSDSDWEWDGTVDEEAHMGF